MTNSKVRDAFPISHSREYVPSVTPVMPKSAQYVVAMMRGGGDKVFYSIRSFLDFDPVGVGSASVAVNASRSAAL